MAFLGLKCLCGLEAPRWAIRIENSSADCSARQPPAEEQGYVKICPSTETDKESSRNLGQAWDLKVGYWAILTAWPLSALQGGLILLLISQLHCFHWTWLEGVSVGFSRILDAQGLPALNAWDWQDQKSSLWLSVWADPGRVLELGFCTNTTSLTLCPVGILSSYFLGSPDIYRGNQRDSQYFPSFTNGENKATE